MLYRFLGFLAICVSVCCASALAQESKEVIRNQNSSEVKPPDGGDWSDLFNGSNLDGWQQRNGWAVYQIEDGAIVGTTAKDSPNSFLCTTKDYADFELKFEVMVNDALNSGVQIRSKSLPERDSGRVHGPQVEIEATGGTAGYVYGESTGRNWISPSQPKHKAFKPGEWNQYHIRAKGNRIQTWINGTMIEDITDPLSHTTGFIGLQVHSVGADQGPFSVRWRNIAVR